MLEQSLVITKSRGDRFLSLPVSIAIHLAIIAAAVAAAVWNVELPSRPPNQVATYSIGQMPAPPGPPPARSGGEVRPKPRIAPLPDSTAPVAIPADVPDVPAGDTASTDTAEQPGDPGGVPWGVDGGVGTGDGGGGVVQGGGDPAPILRPGGDVSIPVVTTRVDPRYPEAARAARLQGVVTIECVIGNDGRVRDPRVVRSAHPILDPAAIDAVKNWRFQPATLNGTAVDVWFYLTVRFTLDR
ncbi:MAG TPA: energy transducer TonB [Thermoanaerobaculia bacterium]